MGTTSLPKLAFIYILKNKDIELFTSDDIRKLFTFENETTLKHLLRRLAKAQQN